MTGASHLRKQCKDARIYCSPITFGSAVRSINVTSKAVFLTFRSLCFIQTLAEKNPNLPKDSEKNISLASQYPVSDWEGRAVSLFPGR